MQRKIYSRLVAIVGRPNVGKSSLFNRIVKQRKSLVHNQPGVTRDRIFSEAEYGNKKFYLCDTGGFEPTSKDNIKIQLVEQAELAIEEAEHIIFVVDGREGLHPIDSDLIRRIRKAGKSFVVAVNKCDLPKDDFLAEEFRKLGVEFVFPVSAEHARGVSALLEKITEDFPEKSENSSGSNIIKLALIGRPNVGKSSILNRMLGEQRSIVDERPGTTRDTVDASLRYQGHEFQVIDTAGIRRKSRMADKLEHFSAFRSMAALEEADVAIIVIDAKEGPTESDARVAGAAFERRKPILIVVNKWDLIEEKDTLTAKRFEESLKDHEFRYLSYAPVLFVSAKENQRVSRIMGECLKLYEMAGMRVKTSVLNRALKEILQKHTPPLTRNKSRRIKFLYASQVRVHPPKFVVFCSYPEEIHFSYARFLENEFRKTFGFDHVPVTIYFRERRRSEVEERKAPDLRDVDEFENLDTLPPESEDFDEAPDEL